MITNVQKEVLVFRTNAPVDLNFSFVHQKLKNLRGILDWNFDLEDKDRIFRVVAAGAAAEVIIGRLDEAGIWAEELQ